MRRETLRKVRPRITDDDMVDVAGFCEAMLFSPFSACLSMPVAKVVHTSIP